MSRYWIICTQEQGGGSHLPNIKVLDMSKLPDKFAEAYSKCEGRSENAVIAFVIGGFTDDDDTEAEDEFYRGVATAEVPFQQNMTIERILTFSAY